MSLLGRLLGREDPESNDGETCCDMQIEEIDETE